MSRVYAGRLKAVKERIALETVNGKVCSDCGVCKPLAEYYFNKSIKANCYGYANDCKNCRAVKVKERKMSRPKKPVSERTKATEKAYKVKNRERARLLARAPARVAKAKEREKIRGASLEYKLQRLTYKALLAISGEFDSKKYEAAYGKAKRDAVSANYAANIIRHGLQRQGIDIDIKEMPGELIEAKQLVIKARRIRLETIGPRTVEDKRAANREWHKNNRERVAARNRARKLFKKT